MTEEFKIRMAKVEDRKHIMGFIKSYWSDSHILAHDQTLFDFQHLENDRLSFAIALDLKNKIVGILGYISYDYLENNQDIVLALWKVIPNLSDPFLGVKLIYFIQENIKPRFIHCVGINKNILGIYKYLGFNTGKLQHYAAFNKSCKKFNIAVPPANLKSINKSKSYIFTETASLNKSLDKLYNSDFYEEKVPYKSRSFFMKRYENHPYFQYKFHEVTTKDFFKGFIVSRVINYNNSNALRIIEVVAEDDYIGEIIDEFATTINSSTFEYIDVYLSNLNNKTFQIKNFEDISSSNKIIVPDHFEPFERKNIDIYFMTSSEQGAILFKGDGDQDRPNI